MNKMSSFNMSDSNAVFQHIKAKTIADSLFHLKQSFLFDKLYFWLLLFIFYKTEGNTENAEDGNNWHLKVKYDLTELITHYIQSLKKWVTFKVRLSIL